MLILKLYLFCYRYLGSGCDQNDLHLYYRVGHSTIGYIIRRVCAAIWEILHEECFPKFTQESWKEITNGFYHRTQFPNCIGALDSKHTRILKPTMSGSLHHNYKAIHGKSFVERKKNFQLQTFAGSPKCQKYVWHAFM
jgi:hypothetical protein